MAQNLSIMGTYKFWQLRDLKLEMDFLLLSLVISLAGVEVTPGVLETSLTLGYHINKLSFILHFSFYYNIKSWLSVDQSIVRKCFG